MASNTNSQQSNKGNWFKQFVQERALRKHVFVIMVGIKLYLILFLLTIWESGGFTNDQFISILGIVTPLFATYISIMFQKLLDAKQDERGDTPVVSRGFQWTSYFLLFAYGMCFQFILGLKPRGIVNFFQMESLLALLEVLLGVYVGKLLWRLFNIKVE